MRTLYLHIFNSTDLKEVSVPATTTIGQLIKSYVPKFSGEPDYEEDLEVYLQDSDEELRKGDSLEKQSISNNAHLHFSRCKKVLVNVEYNGNSYTEKFNSSSVLEHVFLKSTKHFNIEGKDKNNLSLFIELNDEPLDLSEHVGCFTGYPTCAVTLYLAKRKTYLG